MSGLAPGQYIPGDSILHRLDARAKLICLFLLLFAVIMAPGVLGYAFAALVTAAVLPLSKLSPRLILGSIPRLWLFFLAIFTLNALFFDSASPLFSWGIFRPSPAGILQGVRIILNVALMMVLGNILMRTTAPMDLTSAFESFLRPLSLFRIPVEEAAIIIGAALMFVPTLIEEADAIKMAQTARGAKFESGKLLERARSYFPLVIPIFLAAFRRADELAFAMEARGYKNARERTKKERHPLHLRDLAALLCGIAALLTQIYVL